MGDIGGTNARFALTDNKGIGYRSERAYTCSDFSTPADAIRQYLHDIANANPARVCLAVAHCLPALGAAEVFERASTHQIAQQTVDLFYQILGQVAGDIALATGAFDGIYLAGGSAQR